MSSTALSASIDEQIELLCQTIAADPEIQSARQQAETFLADEAAVSLYRDVMNMGRNLEQRHRSGQEISNEEVEKFEALQEKADAHDGIRAFNQAQDKLQEIANKVNGFVTKTLEKGRVPSHDEVFGGGSCGSGCGCH